MSCFSVSRKQSYFLYNLYTAVGMALSCYWNLLFLGALLTDYNKGQRDGNPHASPDARLIVCPSIGSVQLWGLKRCPSWLLASSFCIKVCRFHADFRPILTPSCSHPFGSASLRSSVFCVAALWLIAVGFTVFCIFQIVTQWPNMTHDTTIVDRNDDMVRLAVSWEIL